MYEFLKNDRDLHSCFILLTLGSIIGSPPASINKTLKFGFSLKRPATTAPDELDPTMIKSKRAKIHSSIFMIIDGLIFSFFKISN